MPQQHRVPKVTLGRAKIVVAMPSSRLKELVAQSCLASSHDQLVVLQLSEEPVLVAAGTERHGGEFCCLNPFDSIHLAKDPLISCVLDCPVGPGRKAA